MDFLQQSFTVSFSYKVHFTTDLFSPTNPILNTFFTERKQAGIQQRVLFVIDEGVVENHPGLQQKIEQYFTVHSGVQLAGKPLIVVGGEAAKNDPALLHRIIQAVDEERIDRHSYLAAIGGGAVLDLAGYGAAIAHRGLKHIRIPTTVLSQNDSGVGVKNGVNFKKKKNFIGTFSPPIAVFNDDLFLTTLNDRHWRSGISEAIKVALIKDAAFFTWLEENAMALAGRDMTAMNYLVKRCAELHMQHISSGDPFEMGSARPLDFGHWSAHKLEQLTGFSVFHGEAVAMGIALDTMYSTNAGFLPEADANRIIHLLVQLGFAITHPLMQIAGNDSPVLKGLEEFREHLGGQLTITLLQLIGKGIEVHEMDYGLLFKAAEQLQHLSPVQG